MSGNQRWRERNSSYRLPTETIRPRDYEVAEISSNTEVRAFVETHHYSGSYPAARRRFGIYRGLELVGVAVFSIPTRPEVLTNVFPGVPESGALDLGRFVLLDSVPGNGETWFLGRVFELLRRDGVVGVIAFSDPLERRTIDNRMVCPGHVGTIYQAFNGHYLGQSKPNGLLLLPDGTSFPRRAVSKIRAGDKGWRYAVERLAEYGAELPRCFGGAPDSDELRVWLAVWLPRLTRTVNHPGNHKYAWALHKPTRRMLPPVVPSGYPKRVGGCDRAKRPAAAVRTQGLLWGVDGLGGGGA